MKTTFLLAVITVKSVVHPLHALSLSPTCLRWKADSSGVTLWPNLFPAKSLVPSHIYQAIKLRHAILPHLDLSWRNGPICFVQSGQCYCTLKQRKALHARNSCMYATAERTWDVHFRNKGSPIGLLRQSNRVSR